MLVFIIGVVIGLAAAVAINAKWPLPFAKATKEAAEHLGI
jgi:hypothetical protein